MRLFKSILILIVLFNVTFSQTAEIYFSGVDLENNTVDIMYDSPEPLGGAQFDVTGAELTDASGGEASSAGWTVSTSSTTWLGFSFSGAVLPSGVNTLTTISFAPTGEEMCLQGVVFSDDG